MPISTPILCLPRKLFAALIRLMSTSLPFICWTVSEFQALGTMSIALLKCIYTCTASTVLWNHTRIQINYIMSLIFAYTSSTCNLHLRFHLWNLLLYVLSQAMQRNEQIGNSETDTCPLFISWSQTFGERSNGLDVNSKIYLIYTIMKCTARWKVFKIIHWNVVFYHP